MRIHLPWHVPTLFGSADVDERTCSKCGISKPETEEFFRRRGHPCRGGLRPDCRECSTARDKAYYERNRERVLAEQRVRAPQRLAYQLTYKRAYYRTERGRAVIERANRKWSRSPEGRVRLAFLQQLRRARVARVESAFTVADWELCLSFFGHGCAYCAIPGRLHQEHVIPLDRGGPYVPWNIVPACGSCNSSKTTKPLDVWFPAQPFYNEERMSMILAYLQAVGAPT